VGGTHDSSAGAAACSLLLFLKPQVARITVIREADETLPSTAFACAIVQMPCPFVSLFPDAKPFGWIVRSVENTSAP
jgi:hypothetical protein